jgi:hypothetical protein
MSRRTRYRPAPKPEPIVGFDMLVREMHEPEGAWIIELFVDGLKARTIDTGTSIEAMEARATARLAEYPGARIKIDRWSGARVRSGVGMPRGLAKGTRL